MNLLLLFLFFCFLILLCVRMIIVGNQVQLNEMVLPRRNIFFSGEDEIEDLELPLIEFEAVVAATEHFSHSNKVGKGGFGVVYKV